MATYSIRRTHRKKQLSRRSLLVIILIVLVLLLVMMPRSSSDSNQQTAQAPLSSPGQVSPPLQLQNPLPWPNYGQSAYGAADHGVLATSTEEQPQVPIASLAKVVTALAILEKKPLKTDAEGPSITFSDADVALYYDYLAKDGTVVPVTNGGSMTQYQALQAILLPSANNVSDSMVIWAFGSLENYVVYANDMLRRNNIQNTTIADASGYSAETTSTAADMVQIGILYMRHPILRKIAQQPEAILPGVGAVKNYNATINSEGLLGIKVGYTEEAGRTFLLADVSGEDEHNIALAAVLGAEDMQTAMLDAKQVLLSGNQGHKLEYPQ